MSPKKTATKSAKSAKGFTAEEKAAMKERARELKAEAAQKDSEKAVLEKIDELAEPDRAIARRLHALIKTAAPELTAKLWYGMPAYYKGSQSIVFFQPATKFKTRYPTLGFNEAAQLDDGDFWPVAYALTKLTAAEEAKITALVKKAVS